VDTPLEPGCEPTTVSRDFGKQGVGRNLVIRNQESIATPSTRN
jgi:hypothetical protein